MTQVTRRSERNRRKLREIVVKKHRPLPFVSLCLLQFQCHTFHHQTATTEETEIALDHEKEGLLQHVTDIIHLAKMMSEDVQHREIEIQQDAIAVVQRPATEGDKL